MTEQPAGETTHDGVAARAMDLTKTYGKGEAEVRALDGVTVDLMKGEFTAVMGPSGSGKSTLMHCLAALDTPTSGEAIVDGTSLGRLKDKDLTTLRRERVGFVFQSFNLVPTLSAEENILLPAEPRRPQAGPRVVRPGRRRRRPAPAARPPSRPRCPAASSSASPVPAPWSASRRSSSPTSPPATSTRPARAEVLGFLRRSVDEFGQTVVMVTHDPVAASYTDRIVFLADGKIVDELRNPDRDAILAKMTSLQDTAAAKAAG